MLTATTCWGPARALWVHHPTYSSREPQTTTLASQVSTEKGSELPEITQCWRLGPSPAIHRLPNFTSARLHLRRSSLYTTECICFWKSDALDSFPAPPTFHQLCDLGQLSTPLCVSGLLCRKAPKTLPTTADCREAPMRQEVCTRLQPGSEDCESSKPGRSSC